MKIVSDAAFAAGPSLGLSQARRATRAIFLVAGMGMSAWAPMVPYVKIRLGLDDANLGLALLVFGGGSMVSMPFVGWLSHRLGNRSVITSAGLLTSLALPLLAAVPNMTLLVMALLYFGVALGAVGVAMNAHAVDVERLDGGRLMSGFHGLFSVGGLTGAAAMSGLLAAGVSLFASSVALALLLAVLVMWLKDDLLDNVRDVSEPSHEGFRLPHAAAWLLGLLCCVSFLAEGSMLDWSAVFLRDVRGVPEASAGFGYACFSGAMVLGRLLGDRVITRFGAVWAVRAGAGVAATGFLLAACTPGVVPSLLGFALIGLGSSNIVPVLFSAAGRLPGTPPAIGIATATTLGYLGLLSGPALIGVLSHAISLPIAFAAVAGLLALVAMAARIVQR